MNRVLATKSEIHEPTMPERFSAYLSIFNDWDLLETALRSISGKVDEIVVVDGAYEWMYPYLRRLGIDPERSDERVMEAVHACGVPIKVVTGLWSNEVEKRIAGYRACSHRYIYRIDADEVLFFHDDRLRDFLDRGAPAARMEMPIYAAPGWIVAGPGEPPIGQQGLLFDREQISPEAHLRYLWLVLGEDRLPPVAEEPPPGYDLPIAFNAHLTNWRTPETSVNRASFYTLNFMRHYHTPWAQESERRPIADFENFFESISAIKFREAFLMNSLVIGQVALADGAVLQPSPIGSKGDADLVPLYARFLDSLADLNLELVRGGRTITRDMVIVFDLSTERSTDAIVLQRAITLSFTAELTAAVVRLRYLIPVAPWWLTVEPAFTVAREQLVVRIPEDEPYPYLRRCLEVQIWSADTAVLQTVRCIRPSFDRATDLVSRPIAPKIDQSVDPSERSDKAVIPGVKLNGQAQIGRYGNITFEDLLAWFEANGGETERQYLAAHFDRLIAIRDFTLHRGSPIRGSRMTILDIGARCLHQAFLFAREGHSLICADLHETLDVPSARNAAKAMGASLVGYDRLDRGEGFADLPENSIDLVLLCDILARLPFNPIMMWRAIYRAMKPDGRIIISTPNPTNLLAMMSRMETLILKGQIGPDTAEILRAGTSGLNWKTYSVVEMHAYFTALSEDFSVSRWTTWGSDHEEESLALRTLIGEDGPSPQYIQDPVVGMLRKMVRAGHPMLGSTIFLEVTLNEKRAGLAPGPTTDV